MRPGEAEKLANQLAPYILRKIGPRTGGIGARTDSGAPADVMAQVLAQDGAGSDLDADLLDGNHAAAFAIAAHNHNTTATATKTADYVLAATDCTVLANKATAILFTLPVAALGLHFWIKNINAGLLTIDADGSQTIDGSLTIVLAQWDAVHLVSDGSNWYIL